MEQHLEAAFSANGSNESLELLLRAARQMLQAGQTEALSQAAANIADWDSVLKMATRNAVIPMLARSMRDEKLVPLPVRKELYQRYFGGAAQNALLATEMHEILAAFHQEGIEALAYKGPALTMLAYKDLSLRHPSSDIDLLLRKQDIPGARAVLEARGYQSVFSHKVDRYLLRRHYHLHFARADRELHVELHWALTPACWPFLVDPDHLWRRAQHVNVAGTPVLALNPECTLLALCAHASKEGWPRLSQILDVGRLIASHPDLNWNWIVAEARRMGRQRVLYLGLNLAAELTGAPVPEFVALEARRDPEVDRLTLRIRQNLARGFTHRAAFHRIALRIWHRPMDRVRYVLYVLHRLPEHFRMMATPSSMDRNVFKVSARLSFVYFFIRPLRYLWKVRDPRLLLRRALRNL